MNHINVEIKARCESVDRVRDVLKKRRADYRGEDRQIDTYFRTPTGRLKLREGSIENGLIHYERDNQSGPKVSRVTRYETDHSGQTLKEVLTRALGVITVVDKRREIYYIENVKIHIDTVRGLGSFVEIEAIGGDSVSDERELEMQCREYMRAFQIEDGDLIKVSYSDMKLRQRRGSEVKSTNDPELLTEAGEIELAS
jgi:predicted adenylyl cyclase CyaB